MLWFVCGTRVCECYTLYEWDGEIVKHDFRISWRECAICCCITFINSNAACDGTKHSRQCGNEMRKKINSVQRESLRYVLIFDANSSQAIREWAPRKSVVKLIFTFSFHHYHHFHARDSFHFYLLLPLCFIYYRWESLELVFPARILTLAWQALIRKHYSQSNLFFVSSCSLLSLLVSVVQ